MLRPPLNVCVCMLRLKCEGRRALSPLCETPSGCDHYSSSAAFGEWPTHFYACIGRLFWEQKSDASRCFLKDRALHRDSARNSTVAARISGRRRESQNRDLVRTTCLREKASTSQGRPAGWLLDGRFQASGRALGAVGGHAAGDRLGMLLDTVMPCPEPCRVHKMLVGHRTVAIFRTPT